MLNRRAFNSGALTSVAAAGLLKVPDARATEVNGAGPTELTVRYATNRKRVGGDERYSSEYEWGPNDTGYHTEEIKLRLIDGSLRPDAVASLSAGETGDRNPRTAIRAFLKAAADAQAQMRALSGPPKPASQPAMVFIHGYAFRFVDVFPVAEQIARGYGCENTFFFSWPSYGTHEQYKRDQPYAYGSGAAAAHFLRDLFDMYDTMPQPPAICLVCHSMGNRVLSAITQELKRTASGGKDYLSKAYFEHVLLFAADEDYRAFNDPAKLEPVLGLARKTINIYANGDDFALLLGEAVNALPELGRTGPYSFPLRDAYGRKRDAAYWLNCQPVADPLLKTLGHQYFRLSQPVMDDARQVLAGVEPRRISGRCPAGFDGQKFDIHGAPCRA